MIGFAVCNSIRSRLATGKPSVVSVTPLDQRNEPQVTPVWIIARRFTVFYLALHPPAAAETGQSPKYIRFMTQS